MAIFGNGKTTVAKATFAERLSSVKAMFQTAHNQASALNDEMQKEIETKQAQRVGYSYSDRVVNNQIDWREEAKKAAEKGIKFDTLTINKTGWYKELSSTTNGVSAPFSTSSKTSQLVEAAALARGGEKTRGLYKATMDSFEASGDTEMTAVYAAYSKEVIS